MIVIPPTIYYDNDGKKYEYLIEKKETDSDGLVTLTKIKKETIKYIEELKKKHENKKSIPIPEPKKEIPIQEPKKILKKINKNITENRGNRGFNETVKRIIIRFIEECFNETRYNDYSNWIRAGFSLKNYFGDEGLEIFHIFSKKYKGYTKEECDKVFKGIKPRDI